MLLFLFYYLCFTATATTLFYTLSLHDALPIYLSGDRLCRGRAGQLGSSGGAAHLGFCTEPAADRKSTRLNSSHRTTSYAVFCLKKKNDTLATSFNYPAGTARHTVSCLPVHATE